MCNHLVHSIGKHRENGIKQKDRRWYDLDLFTQKTGGQKNEKISEISIIPFHIKDLWTGEQDG